MLLVEINVWKILFVWIVVWVNFQMCIQTLFEFIFENIIFQSMEISMKKSIF